MHNELANPEKSKTSVSILGVEVHDWKEPGYQRFCFMALNSSVVVERLPTIDGYSYYVDVQKPSVGLGCRTKGRSLREAAEYFHHWITTDTKGTRETP